MSLNKMRTRVIWFIIPFLAILALFVVRQNLLMPDPGEVIDTGQGFVGSRQGDRIVYDFATGFRQVELALTQVMAAGGLAPTEYSRIEREAEYSQPLAEVTNPSWFRPQLPKSVKWQYKELTVLAPNTDGGLLVFDYQRMLENYLAKFGARVISEEMVEVDFADLTWDKLSEMVADIDSERVIGIKLALGFPVDLAGQQVTVVTHEITLVQPWSQVYAQRFPGKVKPKIAIVLDDWGYDYADTVQAMFNLPVKLNMAVIPGLPKAADQAVLGYARGWEVMLHLPMEPQSPGWRLGEYGVMTEMSDGELRETVRKGIEAVPAISGVNNHMGSKATADSRVVRIVLEEISRRGLFFVDSHTTGASVVPNVAASLNIPIAENQVFLDNEDNVDYILQRLALLVEVAMRQGKALGIGHLRPNTARALERFFRSPASANVEVVFASSLVSS